MQHVSFVATLRTWDALLQARRVGAASALMSTTEKKQWAILATAMWQCLRTQQSTMVGVVLVGFG